MQMGPAFVKLDLWRADGFHGQGIRHAPTYNLLRYTVILPRMGFRRARTGYKLGAHVTAVLSRILEEADMTDARLETAGLWVFVMMLMLASLMYA